MTGLFSSQMYGRKVTYWFERARSLIQGRKAQRVGLIATQAIRQGVNRQVLAQITQTGQIFMAWSDRAWILDGAAVRVSIIGFDGGDSQSLYLDGKSVKSIKSNLRSDFELGRIKQLPENVKVAFVGGTKKGAFDITYEQAQQLLSATNDSGYSNSDVLCPWINGNDITGRSRNMWIIDFGVDTSESKAMQYEKPYEYVRSHVKPARDKVRNKKEREHWWLQARPAPDLRIALQGLKKYIATPRVAKYRLFVFINVDVFPGGRVVAIARSDEYFLGVLQSKMHEKWALATSSWHGVGNDPTYNARSCFATFPFPWPPGEEPQPTQEPGSCERVAAIAEAARQLVALRQGWLHPPEAEIGVTISERMLKKRTLTNMYNALGHYRANVKGRARNPRTWRAKISYIELDEIETLDHIHSTLDNAVLDAYGWPHNLSDEGILERLLALNLERYKRNNP